MKYVVPANQLIAELARDERIEVRRTAPVGRDLAKLVNQLGRPPRGGELEVWLEDHRMVSEVFVSARELDEAIHRHLAPLFARPQVLAEARHQDLEREIRNAPDRVDAYMVYSDYLQESSDPLGELIAYGVAADGGNDDDVVRFERHLKLHRARFLEGIEHLVPTQIQLKWRYGLVSEIHAFARLGEDIWRKMLELRVCGFLDTLRVGLTGYGAGDGAVVAAVTEHAPSSLRNLELSGFHELIIPPSLLQRNLARLALQGYQVTVPDVFPDSVEALHLAVSGIECPGEQPSRWGFRELEVLLRMNIIEFLSEVDLSGVERMTLSLREYDRNDGPLSRLLGPIQLPALCHLGLIAGRVESDLVRDLAGLPIARQLRSLALKRLGMTDEHAKTIARDLAGFEAVTEIDLSGNELTHQGLAEIRAVVPEVVSRRQNKKVTAAHSALREFAGSRWRAAHQIADPGRWRRSGIDGDVCWARYRGSNEYELFVTRDLSRYGCTCPSSIQPCKHVVALALVAEQQELRPAPSNGIEERVRSGGRW